MKIRVLTLTGTASVLAGIFLSGCTGPEVLVERPYIPAPSDSGEEVVVENISQEKVTVDLAPDVPAVTPVVSDLPPLETIKADNLKYTVKKGDSLWKVARKYGVSFKELAAYNNISIKKPIMVGDVLNIPPGGRLVPESELKKVRSSRRPSVKKRKTASPPVKRALMPSSGTYSVRKGDYLGKIASRFGVKQKELAKANNLQSPYALQVGQKLVIPGGKMKVSGLPNENTNLQEQLNAVPEPVKKNTPKESSENILKDIPDPDAGKSEKDLLQGLDFDSGKTKNVEVMENTTVEAFAAKNGVTPAEIRKRNPEIGEDGKISKGDIVTLPE